jgi:hypothetical protein
MSPGKLYYPSPQNAPFAPVRATDSLIDQPVKCLATSKTRRQVASRRTPSAPRRATRDHGGRRVANSAMAASYSRRSKVKGPKSE